MHNLLPDWTSMPEEERRAKVVALLAEGHPFSKIARHFRNCTRSSVIGYCDRRKLSRPGRIKPAKPAASPIAVRPEPNGRGQTKALSIAGKIDARKQRQLEAMPLPEEEAGVDVTHLLGIMQLKTRDCRWISGDPLQAHGYCGKRAKDGSSYCVEHHARVYLVGRP